MSLPCSKLKASLYLKKKRERAYFFLEMNNDPMCLTQKSVAHFTLPAWPLRASELVGLVLPSEGNKLHYEELHRRVRLVPAGLVET